MTQDDIGVYYCNIFKKNGQFLTSIEFELHLSDEKTSDDTPEMELRFLSNDTIEIGSTFQIECLNKTSKTLKVLFG